MRYTECRLTPMAELLLSEIDRDTVDFAPNYDGAFKEPKLLPARLPMLLLNGASGIAVGMATEIPSHNLGEVARAVVATIRNPRSPLDAAARAASPGPTSPAAARSSRSPRRSAPSTRAAAAACACARAGRSRSSRAASGRSRCTELPLGVSTRAVLEDIERATNPKPKEGKKSLSQEQLNLKNLMLVGARHGARRVGQVARRCASCSSRSRAARTRPSSCNCCSPTRGWSRACRSTW